MKIDVVTTAILRPEIFELALRSYFGGGISNLPELRLILNIDPIGNGGVHSIIKIARQYVPEVVVRTPAESNFSAAINWAWSQVETDYFLHLEDDWLFTRPVNFDLWYRDLMESKESVLQSVLLRKKPREQNSRFSFRASLVDSKVISNVLPIPLQADPEKYVALRLGEGVSRDFGVSYQLVDMGRKWAKSQRYRKSAFADRLNMPISDKGCGTNWFGARSINPLGNLEYKFNRLYWRWIQSRYIP